MMNYKKSKLIIILLVVLSFLLTSCSNNNIIPIVSPSPTPVPQVESWIGDEKLIQVIMPSEIESTNPFLVTKTDTLSLYNLIFEPLVSLSEVGKPTPSLAKSWKVDDSGTKWTFVLRDNVFWHNTGREINSQDIQFTLDLMQEVKEDSIHCQVMGYIKNWEIVDDKTVLITTFEPFYGFLMGMDFPILPYDVGYSSNINQAQFPVGTGPYKIKDFRPGLRMELQLNEKWWQIHPSIETIVAEPYNENSIAVSALSLGQIDIVQTNEVTVSQLRESASINTYEYTTNFYEFLIPNISQSILLRDERIRQAIALSINRQEIISNVYVNHAVITEAPVLPSSWLYEGTISGYERDIEEAKRLLTLSGWKKQSPTDLYFNISPDGVIGDFTLVLITNDNKNDSLRYETAQIISKQLTDIGIKVEVKSLDWEIFERRVSEGYFDLLLAGWYISDIPDLRNFFSTEGKNNISGYSNEQMDDLLENVMQQSSEDDLKHSFKKVQDLIVSDVPLVSLYFRTNTLLTRSRIIGVTEIKEGDAFRSIELWEIVK